MREIGEPVVHRGALTVLAVVCAALVMGAIARQPTKPAEVTPMKTIANAAVCALTLDDVPWVADSYRRGDMDALRGLVARGRAIVLAKGTLVDVAVEDGADWVVVVRSGAHVGETCHLLAGMAR